MMDGEKVPRLRLNDGSIKPKSIVRSDDEYQILEQGYDHFNSELFDGAVPAKEVMLTLIRRAHSRGHFSSKRFSHRLRKADRHEVNLNPDHFYDRSDREICSTMVHEMCHHWQEQCGTAKKRHYHDREWAAKMIEVGLMPSNTGTVGGKTTGSSMSHYIVEGGRFDQAFAKLAATGFKLPWQSTPYARPGRAPISKTKFTCSHCSANAWGKPDLSLICGDCYDSGGALVRMTAGQS
jgi:hypothetical protein